MKSVLLVILATVAVALAEQESKVTSLRQASATKAASLAKTKGDGESHDPNCHPKCQWKCDAPICNQVCSPICEVPKCSTRCKELKCSKCTIECEEPKCEVRCPVKECLEGACPTCDTVCDEAVCRTVCAKEPEPDCQSICQEPRCDYVCKKPTKCPPPKCMLLCESEPTCVSGEGVKKYSSVETDLPDGFKIDDSGNPVKEEGSEKGSGAHALCLTFCANEFKGDDNESKRKEKDCVAKVCNNVKFF